MTEPASDQLLRDFLAANDAECPICEYNLRGVVAARCPECAAPIELSIASPRSLHAPWIFAVVSYSMAMGFDSVVAALVVVATVMSGTYTQLAPYVLLAIFFTGAAACGIGLLRTIRGRRRWLRRAANEQWASARLTFFLVGGVHAVAGAVFIYLVN